MITLFIILIRIPFGIIATALLIVKAILLGLLLALLMIFSAIVGNKKITNDVADQIPEAFRNKASISSLEMGV